MIKNKFVKNVLVLLLSQGFIKILGIVYKLYLTNKTGYGDIGNALFIAPFQVYAIFLTICSIGVPNAISCLISEKLANGMANEAYRVLKVALTIFGTLGFTLSCMLFYSAKIISNSYLQMEETDLIIKILAPSIFVISITAVLKGYFNGRQKINITANSLLIEQVFRTVLTCIFVEILSNITKNNTLTLVCGVAIASTLCEAISLFYMYFKLAKLKKEIWTDIITSKVFKKERICIIVKNILKISFPITLCALISMGNKTIDTITIVRIAKKYLGEKEAVRQYGILSGKIESLILFPVSFNIALTTVLIPKISEFRAKGEFKKAKELLKLSMLTGILIGIPFFIIMFVFSEQILTIFFPNASDGYIMLKYSSIIIIIAILNQTINSYLQGMNKMKIQIISVSIGCIVKFVLNIILIENKQINIYGAIISNIVSYTIIFLILIFYLIRKEKIKFIIGKYLIKPVILTISLYLIYEYIYKTIMTKSSILSFGLSIIIGGVAYLGMIILFRVISPKDIKVTKPSKHNIQKTAKYQQNFKKIK